MSLLQYFYQNTVILFYLLTFAACLKDTQTCTGYDCLKSYVDKIDPVYSWTDTGKRLRVEDQDQSGIGWTGYILNFTSQSWLTPGDTSSPIWWHSLVVIIPDNLENRDTPFVYITGDSNNEDFVPDESSGKIQISAMIAVNTQSAAACLFHIPNQPIVYATDPIQMQRYEDESIAFTWRHFIDDPTSDAEWLLRLPMTKAVVRAMDTIQEFAALPIPEIQELELNPTQFIIGGASKRGWTTWTTSAVDPRVMAAVPIVMDELNFLKNIKHHFRSLGGWSFALNAYHDQNLTMDFDNPKMQDMFDIVDAYEYRDKLIMPKLVCNSAGDQFFLPDDSEYWWHDMPMAYEMNRFIIIPNSEHGVLNTNPELMSAIVTWMNEILNANDQLKKKYGGIRPPVTTIDERNAASIELIGAAQIPRYNYSIDEISGDITLVSEISPSKVYLWEATSCNSDRKDFRLENIDHPCDCGVADGDICINMEVAWSSVELQETSPGSLTWVAHRDAPTDGRWTAFFVDLQYEDSRIGSVHPRFPLDNVGTFHFTTGVSIVPNTFPVEDCEGINCYGTLV